jgi:hypothetical protein
VSTLRGGIEGLEELAACLCRHREALAAYDAELIPGASFQASAAAVSTVNDGVLEARSRVIERMSATGERVAAAARNFAATEELSAAAIRAVSETPVPQ